VKILQLHNRYRQQGGEDAVVSTEAELLRKEGHEVRTFVTANPADEKQAIRRLLVAPWNPASAARVRRLAADVLPDIAHVHNTWYSLTPSVLAALRRLGIPVVMTLHNYRLLCAAATLFRDGSPCTDCVGSHPWHAVAHRCYRDSVGASAVASATIAGQQLRRTWQRDVDHFIALSGFGRTQFLAGGLPSDRVSVKYNSVADPGPRSTPPSSSGTVLFVGRLSAEKGVLQLLEAWRKVSGRLELVIVGSGPLDDQLRATASGRVRFVGQQDPAAVTALMQRARALVFPSLWFEGLPLVPIEAAAAGLPVLLSDLGAMSEIFEPGGDELLLPAGDPTALADRLQYLHDDAFVDRYGRFVRERFEERYTHERSVAGLEQIYGRQLAESGR
jgi:glycosyltransferase involved in cell wall biosynthesis